MDRWRARRYALGTAEILVGRAPNSSVVLNEPEVGWRHCQIRQQGDRFLVIDLRTSLGTYVNGMRSAERWLEDRDQIGVGKTILMFRSSEASARRIRCPLPPQIRSPYCWQRVPSFFYFVLLRRAPGKRR